MHISKMIFQSIIKIAKPRREKKLLLRNINIKFCSKVIAIWSLRFWQGRFQFCDISDKFELICQSSSHLEIPFSVFKDSNRYDFVSHLAYLTLFDDDVPQDIVEAPAIAQRNWLHNRIDQLLNSTIMPDMEEFVNLRKENPDDPMFARCNYHYISIVLIP